MRINIKINKQDPVVDGPHPGQSCEEAHPGEPCSACAHAAPLPADPFSDDVLEESKRTYGWGYDEQSGDYWIEQASPGSEYQKFVNWLLSVPADENGWRYFRDSSNKPLPFKAFVEALPVEDPKQRPPGLQSPREANDAYQERWNRAVMAGADDVEMTAEEKYAIRGSRKDKNHPWRKYENTWPKGRFIRFGTCDGQCSVQMTPSMLDEIQEKLGKPQNPDIEVLSKDPNTVKESISRLILNLIEENIK